jgi:hypothetical protein
VLTDFWTAFADGDGSWLRGLLADGVAFASPAFAEPTVGGDTVAHVLTTARGVYAGLTLTHELGDGGDGGALFFGATVGGQAIQGVYRVDVDAGRVVRIDALFRPVAAAETLVRLMMERLAAGGPA